MSTAEASPPLLLWLHPGFNVALTPVQINQITKEYRITLIYSLFYLFLLINVSMQHSELAAETYDI